MIKLIADYHTHTIFSHGKGTIEQNVEAAIKKGLKRIGIADHGFQHIGYGVSLKDVMKIRKTIDSLNQIFQRDIEILMGVEANLIGLDGEIDIPDEYLKIYDILLVGFHKAVVPFSVKDGWYLFIKNGFSTIMPFLQADVRKRNTDVFIRAIERYNIDIITHPGAKINIDTRRLAQAAASKNTALEINAHHGFMTVEYVKIAMEEKARFVINSDAHHPSDIGNFEKGVCIAVQAGLPSDWIMNAEGSRVPELQSEMQH